MKLISGGERLVWLSKDDFFSLFKFSFLTVCKINSKICVHQFFDEDAIARNFDD